MSEISATPNSQKISKAVTDCGTYKHLKWITQSDETIQGEHPRRKDRLTVSYVNLNKGKLIHQAKFTYAHYSAKQESDLYYEIKIANIMKSWHISGLGNNSQLDALKNEEEIVDYFKEHGQIKEKSIAKVEKKKKPKESDAI